MKLLIASDIHGSAYYCEKLWEAYEREQASRMLLLGDILYHGPRNDLPREYAPKRVIAMMNERRESLFAVRGNCDTEVDQMVLSFPIMADYAILPFGDRMIYATHGHKFSPQNMPAFGGRDILLYGHTHIWQAEKVDGHICLNPGSVSIPKGGNPPTYALLENGVFSVRTFEGEELAAICLTEE